MWEGVWVGVWVGAGRASPAFSGVGGRAPCFPCWWPEHRHHPLHGALRWLFPHSPVRLRGLSTPTLMPSNRDSALRGRRARSVRRDLMGPSSA